MQPLERITRRTLGRAAAAALCALASFHVAGTAVSRARAQTIPPTVAKSPADGRASGEAGTGAPPSVTRRMEKEGVRVELTIAARPDGGDAGGRLVAGADATATFRVTDARTGQPLTGLRPNAWLSARRSERALSETECKDKIRAFVGGLLSVRPDVDLNGYHLLTLNHDNTITFINPQVAFSRTKLESIVPLPGAGADWALSKRKEFLYVTLPELSAVAVVNTVTRKLAGTIPVGDKSKPTRAALDPDGRFLWVGLDGAASVAVIDTTTNKLAAAAPAGAGQHAVAFTRDGRFAYVTNGGADTVSVIDAQTFKKVSDIPVAKTPSAVAYSAAADLVYVAAVEGDAVSVIDPSRREVVKTIPVGRGVAALRFEPGGRYGFAVNRAENTVSVIDASTNTVVGSAEVAKAPDQVTFTRRYAYVRGTGSEKFSLIELGTIGKGRIAPVDVQAGQRPPSAAAADMGVSDMIAPTPEGNAAVIANAPDTMLYYYVEGMMAPMGTYSNYKRRPRALLILDRSLEEVAPGVYSAPLRLKTGGRFDVPFILDQPRVVNCFQLEVGDSPDAEKGAPAAALAVKPLFAGRQFKPGESVALRFRLTDPATGRPLKGLADVQVLVFEPPGVWQQRQWAREAGDGEYEVTQVFPHAGLYQVMLRVESRGTTFGDTPATSVPVADDARPNRKEGSDN